MALENILSQEIVQKLGWTLLHFVWQAAVVALLLGILLAVLRKSTANLRYIVACLSLGLIVLLPIVTMQLVPVSAPQPTANIEPAPIPAPVTLPAQEFREIPALEMTVPEEPIRHEITGTAFNASWKQRAADLLELALPYIVSAWLLGVFGLSLWHLGGWAQLQRLRKKLVRQVDDSVHNRLRLLSKQLHVKQAVQLLESALVQVPTVVGWLRPVILLPATALTGLSSEQLEALLAHELAHIRRYDYLVNMLQTVVETLGFYHPAVWWVSHKIRIERENCCDDLAISISGDRVNYARALTSMEEIRADRSELAVAATGGNLFSRIRRLIGKNSTEKTFSWIPAVTVISLLVALIIPTTLALTTKEKYPTAEFITNKSENGQPEKEPPNTEKINSSTKILIETQFIHVNNEFLEQVGLDAASLKNPNSWTQYRIDDSSNPSMFVIDSHTKEMLLKIVDESEDSSSISHIFLMAMSGQEAMIKNNSGYDFKSQELGRFIKIKPELSQDGKSVNVDCELTMRQFKSLNLFFDVYINKKVDQNDVSESEIVEFQTNAGNILLPDDHTLLILGGKLVSLRDVEKGTPILRDIPFVGELFNTTSKVKVEKNEIILIKTSIATPQQSDDIDSKASSYNVDKIVGSKTSELLRIYLDLHLEAGQYVEIKDRGQRELKFVQVNTSDIGKSSKDFPAYAGYIDFEIRSNFDLNLATKRYTRGSFLEHDKWDAYFTGPDTIIGNGNFSPTTLCVSMWRVKLYQKGSADDDIIPSLVAVIIKPSNKPQEKSDVMVESNEGRIEGRIIDVDTGKGISGVQLAVVSNSSPESNERFTCISTENGTFIFGGLQSGEYLLQGDFPSVDVDVVSGRSTNDVLIGISQGETVPAPTEITAEQQGNGEIIIGMRMIEMPADAMKEALGPNENFSSGLLVRHGHEISGRLLTLSQERKDAKQLAAPQVLMENNSNSTIELKRNIVYIGGYESVEGEREKLTAQHKNLEIGWKFKLNVKILEGGEKVHIELAAKQQKHTFETLQYREGYDYQIPSPPEIFVIEMTAKNGEPVVICRPRDGEPAFCLIVTPSAILPERQPEPLLGKKLPEPDNIQNIDDLKLAEGKPALICFWDMNQRPSRNTVAELTKREKELAEKNVAVYLVHTSNTKPVKLQEWLDNRNISFACGSIKDNADEVLFRWGIRAQPWLILTDQNKIVRSEGLSLDQLDEKLQGKESNLSLKDEEVIQNHEGQTNIEYRGFVRDEKGKPIKGAKVCWFSEQSGGLSLNLSEQWNHPDVLTTDKRGEFMLRNVSGNKIGIYVKAEGYAQCIIGPLVLPEDSKKLKQIVLQPGSEVFGRVILEDGQNVVGARVSVLIFSAQLRKMLSSPWPCLTTKTDENGFYRLVDLPAGQFSIGVNSPLAEGNLNMTQKKINLERGEKVELNFGDEERFTLTGVVTVDGEPVEIASVRIQLPNESTKWGWTDRNGNFRITGIPSGQHQLFTTYDKDLDPVTFLWGKDGKQNYDTRFDRRQITIERDLSVDIHIGEQSSNNNLLVKSAAPSGVEKPIVKVDLSVVEVFSDLKMDRETTVMAENILGKVTTVPRGQSFIGRSTTAAHLLREASEATAAAKDESAGDKRVTQEQFQTLVDTLVSRGYVNILMNPTLEVVDGGTATIRSEQKIPSMQDSLEDFIQISPHVSKDYIILLEFKAIFSSQTMPKVDEQTPIINIHEIATLIRLSPGESGVVSVIKQAGTTTEPGKDAKDLEVPATEMLVILTPTIVDSAEPKEPMVTVNFENVEAGMIIEKLAKWTGKVIIPTADLMKQKITIYSPEQMPRSEAVALILNSLRSKGYTAEQSDETIFLKAVTEEQFSTDKNQIMIDTKILTTSDDFMKYIGLDPNSAANSEGWTDYLVHSTDDSASFVVDQLHIDLLLRNVAAHMRTHKDITMLTSPQALVMSGYKFEMHIPKSKSSYYTLKQPGEPNALSGESESKSNHIEFGTTIRMTPTLTPDGKNIELDFEWEYRQHRGFKQHTSPDGKVQKVPRIDVDSIKTPCTVPDGKTLLIAGKKITEHKKKEPRKFGLADLPLIGRLFYRPRQAEEKRNLLIMVTLSTDIKAPPIPQSLVDPNDPLIKKLEDKFKRYDEKK